MPPATASAAVHPQGQTHLGCVARSHGCCPGVGLGRANLGHTRSAGSCSSSGGSSGGVGGGSCSGSGGSISIISGNHRRCYMACRLQLIWGILPCRHGQVSKKLLAMWQLSHSIAESAMLTCGTATRGTRNLLVGLKAAALISCAAVTVAAKSHAMHSLGKTVVGQTGYSCVVQPAKVHSGTYLSGGWLTSLGQWQ
jgi:hypothetical protein